MIDLTAAALRQMMPRAPQAVIDAFSSDGGRAWLAKAGITDNRKRLATAFAHVGHECSDFTIANLTENINYTAARMAQVWPKRFPGGAADVQRKYGTGPGWQRKAFDDIYGNRMGNRPGTSDGSRYIGRGGPQITGRDGYREVGIRCGLPLEDQPELACLPEHQPAILAAFWVWKELNLRADNGGVPLTVERWNGGTNGLADRLQRYDRLLPIIAPLRDVDVPAAPVPTAPNVPAPSLPPQAPPSPQPPEGAGLFALVARLASLILSAFKGKNP